jgi:predicted amidohydrolase YtcJ
MKKLFPLLFAALALASCMKGQSVDLIVHNARIHTMDENNSVEEAMAIRDGKIVEVGPERQIMNKYSADEYIDAEKKDVFPGFTDSHGHMMSYARQLLSVDLVGSKSFKEMIIRVEKYAQAKHPKFIIGRGWDQSLWGGDVLPSNEELNRLFPDIPVMLHRIDGHAALVNQKALDLAGITASTVVEGGSVASVDGNCTGLLLDNAINLVSARFPDFGKQELAASLQEVEHELLQYGVTGVHEAGVEQKDYQLLKNLVDKDKLHIDLYVMLFPTPENIAFAKKNGIVQHKNLNVRSFKVIGDGALGSRGALLKDPYSDEVHNHGLLTTSGEEMKRVALIAESIGYQVNFHAIGDSANRIVLELISDIRQRQPDHRWRVEHAQVVDPNDFALFEQVGAFPSVQPTHAVSDQRWAGMRLGKDRMKGAYAYKTLLQKCGMLALGTDFPVEQTNPFLTLHAAVNRTNAEGDPIGGFLPSEALTVDECLKGMTIWPAYAGFRENDLGTLEKGKTATFVILAFPFRIGKVFESNYAFKVFIRGRERYTSE